MHVMSSHTSAYSQRKKKQADTSQVRNKIYVRKQESTQGKFTGIPNPLPYPHTTRKQFSMTSQHMM